MLNTTEIKENTLVLKEIIESKNPALAKKLPGFVYSYLNKILHIADLNRIIYLNRDKTGLHFVTECLKEFGANVVSHNTQNIKKEDRILIASNHPLGGMDGLAIMQEVGKIRKDILFPVNDFLFLVPLLRPLFIPINKHGSNQENIALFNKAFESDNAILYFPAGLCSRQQSKNVIYDLEWKQTIITKAIRYQRNIIPTFTDGRNSTRFYRIASWRTKLGIKTNIEMLYLTDEMYRQKGITTNIYFGEPIPYQFFDKSRKPKEWAKLLQGYVYTLKEQRITFEQYIKTHAL